MFGQEKWFIAPTTTSGCRTENCMRSYGGALGYGGPLVSKILPNWCIISGSSVNSVRKTIRSPSQQLKCDLA